MFRFHVSFPGCIQQENSNAPSCNTTQRGQRWFGEGLSMLFTLIVLVHGSLALKDGSDKDEIRPRERCGGFTYGGGGLFRIEISKKKHKG